METDIKANSTPGDTPVNDDGSTTEWYQHQIERLERHIHALKQDIVTHENAQGAIIDTLQQLRNENARLQRIAPDPRWRIQYRTLTLDTSIVNTAEVAAFDAQLAELVSRGWRIEDVTTSVVHDPPRAQMRYIRVVMLKHVSDIPPSDEGAPPTPPPPAPEPHDTPYLDESDESEGVEEAPEALETEELPEVSEPAARRVTGIIHLEGEPENRPAWERAQDAGAPLDEVIRLADEDLARHWMSTAEQTIDLSIPFEQRMAGYMAQILGVSA